MTDAARCEKIMKRVRMLERSQFRVFDREMEENRDVYDARMRCITSLLGLNFCYVFPYEEWITSRVDDYIFLFQSSSKYVLRYRETSINFERRNISSRLILQQHIYDQLIFKYILRFLNNLFILYRVVDFSRFPLLIEYIFLPFYRNFESA